MMMMMRIIQLEMSYLNYNKLAVPVRYIHPFCFTVESTPMSFIKDHRHENESESCNEIINFSNVEFTANILDQVLSFA